MDNVNKKRVLIIDDDNRNVFALSAVLKSRGYKCVAVADGEEGLDLLSKQEDIGIVLMDMMMPEMDGYTLIPIIKNDKEIASIPVVAVTAQAMPGDKERCLDAGADAYLSKPIDIDELMKLLNKFLK